MTLCSISPALQGIEQSELAQTTALGHSTNATVYRELIGRTYYAVKIFRNHSALELPKIQAMIENPPNLYSDYKGITYPKYGWPLALIRDVKSGEPIGYVMDLFDTDKTKTLDYFFDPRLASKLSLQSSNTLPVKIEILKNLCDLIADLHARGHQCVDVNPDNIRAFEGANIVGLIGCDGYAVRDKSGKSGYRADRLSADYIAPEIAKLDVTRDEMPLSQDEYALAVLIYQMLNRGEMPFAGRLLDPTIQAKSHDDMAVLGLFPHDPANTDKIAPLPASIYDTLLPETQSLFLKAFTGQKRPTAQDWSRHFRKILDENWLVSCETRPELRDHMRFRDRGCAACMKPIAMAAKPTQDPLVHESTTDHQGHLGQDKSDSASKNQLKGDALNQDQSPLDHSEISPASKPKFSPMSVIGIGLLVLMAAGIFASLIMKSPSQLASNGNGASLPIPAIPNIPLPNISLPDVPAPVLPLPSARAPNASPPVLPPAPQPVAPPVPEPEPDQQTDEPPVSSGNPPSVQLSSLSNTAICSQALDAMRTDWDWKYADYISEATISRNLSLENCRSILGVTAPVASAPPVQPINSLVAVKYCNKAGVDLFLVYAYKSGASDWVRGHYKVSPGACHDAGSFQAGDIYWYAKASNNLEWQGSDPAYGWCIDPVNKFDIPRRTSCGSGETLKRFFKITTDQSSFTMNLTR